MLNNRPRKRFTRDNVLKEKNVAGVYTLYDEFGNRMYVGRTSGSEYSGLKKRLSSYYQKDDLDGEHNEKKALRKHGIAYYSTTPVKDKKKRRQLEKKRKKGTMFNIL